MPNGCPRIVSVKFAVAPVYRGKASRKPVGSAQRFQTGGFLRIFSSQFLTTTLALLVAAVAIMPATAASLSELRPATASAAPLFRLDDYRGGKILALEEQRGKIVLLHFFATYCEPCRPEMASLNKFIKADRENRFAVFAVDVGEVDLRVRAFFEKEPVAFPIVLDRDRKVAKAWGVSALPTTIVLNEQLEPKLVVEGDLDWSNPDVLKTLETLLPPRSHSSPRTGG